MSEKIKDGGPAFPHLKPMFKYDGNGIATAFAPELNGMSLRDWFAGQALAGMMADPSCNPEVGHSLKVFAHGAYAIADAMLKARSELAPLTQLDIIKDWQDYLEKLWDAAHRKCYPTLHTDENTVANTDAE